jgi:hypothetical protein
METHVAPFIVAAWIMRLNKEQENWMSDIQLPLKH